MKRLGIVVGESSGDRLGSGLVSALRDRYPNLEVEGVVGPRLLAAGAHAMFSSERLAVMGLNDVVRRVPEFHHMRKRIVEHFLHCPPDVFVGIDAPEFNLGLESRLRQGGVRTVQYVSPQVWAWREWRVKSIARAVNLILTLFPFEAAYYKAHHVPVCCVGHPLAEEMAAELSRVEARQSLRLDAARKWVAICPGSRANEWHYHMRPFIETAQWLSQRLPELGFVVAAINGDAEAAFRKLAQDVAPNVDFQIAVASAREVLGAADVVLTVSGTATLETLLAKRPMVVAYRLGQLSYWIARSLVRVPYIAMPNLLAGKRLVPEFIQSDVHPEVMGQEVLRWINSPEDVEKLHREYDAIHKTLRLGGSKAAAAAILELCQNPP